MYGGDLFASVDKLLVYGGHLFFFVVYLLISI